MSHHDVNEKIARRAYEIYLNRGGEHGSDLNDWLQAEKEVLSMQSGSGNTVTPSKTAPRKKAARKR